MIDHKTRFALNVAIIRTDLNMIVMHVMIVARSVQQALHLNTMMKAMVMTIDKILCVFLVINISLMIFIHGDKILKAFGL